tara:strand:+ start:1071 stop:1748 length:678 start_codon:yes stop_codon:yes gene_type:complete
MKTAIVIPIKTNNQRLPGKNTKLLAGRPLYDYVFQTVKKCKSVDDIYIDSSDDEILNIATENGFSTIKRPTSLNSPETSGNDLLNFEMEVIKHDIVCQVFVTLPFLSAQSIDLAINTLKEGNSITSVLPVYKVYDRFWYFNADNFIYPVNHNPDNLLGTQYMQPICRESGFYVFKRNYFLEKQRRISNNFKEVYIPPEECIDIDTHLDFLYAESVATWKKYHENR